MKVRYNVAGQERRRMADIIGSVIGVTPIYKGAPGFDYEIDQFIITRDGSLIFDEHRDEFETEAVLNRLEDDGFEAEELEEPEKTTGLAIQMPMMTGDEISRLEALIESKESLIKKALEAESLMIGEKNGKLDFPWFKAGLEPDEIKAYMDFVTALCKMAKKSKRVTGKDKPVDNEKYAFRCFLLRLGFIGDEYKTSRKILLRNFTGSAAFKNGGAENEISE